MPTPTAIIFDFDYTLVDPSRGIVECINYALQGMGLAQASPGAIHGAVQAPLRDAFCALAGPGHADRYDEFFKLFVERADAVMVDRTRPLPGVAGAVATLTSREYALGIVSSKHRPHIEPVLVRENLHHRFDVVVGGDDVSHPKPDPEGILHALDALGAAASTALYVGDTLGDAEAAQRAGVPFVAVLSGPTPATAFDTVATHHILPSVADLPTWLSQLPGR